MAAGVIDLLALAEHPDALSKETIGVLEPQTLHNLWKLHAGILGAGVNGLFSPETNKHFVKTV
jgi:hypothetical protein